MSRQETQIERKSGSSPNGVSRARRWLKAIALSAAFMLGLGAVQTAQAHDRWGYGYGYGDPYHNYSGPYNHHTGPHSDPHVGDHFHWSHGYHYGPHWQRHYDDHGSAGHFGWRPWSWH